MGISVCAGSRSFAEGEGMQLPVHRALGEGMGQDVSAWTAAGSLERVTAGLG